MKRFNFVSIILISVIIISIIICCKAVYEDDDFIFDIFGNTNNLMLFEELFICVLFCFGIFYEYEIISFSAHPAIAYLARHEKSPPGDELISAII